MELIDLTGAVGFSTSSSPRWIFDVGQMGFVILVQKMESMDCRVGPAQKKDREITPNLIQNSRHEASQKQQSFWLSFPELYVYISEINRFRWL